jgi:phosphatidate phosphatase APP1
MTKDGVRGILKSTFVDTPTPISGMPELYKTIQSAVSPTWFFVSASPYNLFPFLRRFLHRYYPAGTIMLRSQSWQDPEGLISMMTESVLDFKVSHITKIHSWLPERKAICVGDSTQFDPEVYATIYRNNPGWVRQIFIRNVTDIGLGQDKNGAARFEEAFQGVPQAVWKVFEDPEELRAAVAALTGGE